MKLSRLIAEAISDTLTIDLRGGSRIADIGQYKTTGARRVRLTNVHVPPSMQINDADAWIRYWRLFCKNVSPSTHVVSSSFGRLSSVVISTDAMTDLIDLLAEYGWD